MEYLYWKRSARSLALAANSVSVFFPIPISKEKQKQFTMSSSTHLESHPKTITLLLSITKTLATLVTLVRHIDEVMLTGPGKQEYGVTLNV